MEKKEGPPLENGSPPGDDRKAVPHGEGLDPYPLSPLHRGTEVVIVIKVAMVFSLFSQAQCSTIPRLTIQDPHMVQIHATLQRTPGTLRTRKLLIPMLIHPIDCLKCNYCNMEHTRSEITSEEVKDHTPST